MWCYWKQSQWIGSNEWCGLKSVGLCVRERTVKGKTNKEEVYYALSLGLDAKQFERVVRQHWQVENGLHWCLDVAFREDHQRYKNKTMAQNLSCLRKLVFNLLKKDPKKSSIIPNVFQKLAFWQGGCSKFFVWNEGPLPLARPE